MKKTFYIQNMVCNRCKTTVKQLVHNNNAHIIELQLGRVVLETSPAFKGEAFKQNLIENGFALIQNPDIKLVETLKINLIELLDTASLPKSISTYLADKTNKDYAALSRTFKKIEGQTIEKYFIQLKIEKVKELIQMQKLSFSEIAYQLGYNSISHLSGQFKRITGMTMSEYQKSREWDRRSLDKIL